MKNSIATVTFKILNFIRKGLLKMQLKERRKDAVLEPEEFDGVGIA